MTASAGRRQAATKSARPRSSQLCCTRSGQRCWGRRPRTWSGSPHRWACLACCHVGAAARHTPHATRSASHHAPNRSPRVFCATASLRVPPRIKHQPASLTQQPFPYLCASNCPPNLPLALCTCSPATLELTPPPHPPSLQWEALWKNLQKWGRALSRAGLDFGNDTGMGELQEVGE